MTLGWHHIVCLNYKLYPVGDANGFHLQISVAVILHIQFGSAVTKTIYLVANYFMTWVLFGTKFMNFHANTNCYLDCQVKCIECTISLFKSALNELKSKKQECIEYEYGVLNTTTPLKRMDFYVNIERLKTASYKQVSVILYLQIQVNVVGIILCLSHTELKYSSWAGCRVCTASRTHKVVDSKTSKI